MRRRHQAGGSVTLNSNPFIDKDAFKIDYNGTLPAISACLDALKTGVPIDAAASLAEAALASLSEVDGRTVTGEIVDEIFSHFCVGK